MIKTIVNQWDIIYIYITLYPIAVQFLSKVSETYTKISHMPNHKTNISIFQSFDIIFSVYNQVKLEIRK
jgi:hypothetical protein